MSYDEHLTSMAGGDGETVDHLAAIEARLAHDRIDFSAPGFIGESDQCMTDRETLLSLVREQRDQIDRVLELADWAGHRGWHIAPATLRNTINEASA